MKEYQVDPETLVLQVTGLVPEDGSHIRQVLFDEIEARLPRDPEARINIQLSELNPGKQRLMARPQRDRLFRVAPGNRVPAVRGTNRALFGG